MEVVGKPPWVTVVMLVKELYLLIAFPLRVVGLAGDDIAYDVHFRIFCEYRISEDTESVVVVVTLLLRVGLVVLVAYLDVFDVEWCGMTVECSHLSILARSGRWHIQVRS